MIDKIYTIYFQNTRHNASYRAKLSAVTSLPAKFIIAIKEIKMVLGGLNSSNSQIAANLASPVDLLTPMIPVLVSPDIQPTPKPPPKFLCQYSHSGIKHKQQSLSKTISLDNLHSTKTPLLTQLVESSLDIE